VTSGGGAATVAAPAASVWRDKLASWAEAIVIPAGVLALSAVAFGIFVALAGADPFEVFSLMYRGSFGTAFSFDRSLERAAPLILTGLCTAIPARLGLVIIGNEGAVVIGGLGAIVVGLATKGFLPAIPLLTLMAAAGFAAGGAWIALAGWLRFYRGINETIASLLLTYIALAIMNHLVEGVMRDPAATNKAATYGIGSENMLTPVPWLGVPWELVYGVVMCVAVYVLIERTTIGFGARVVGSNVRAALIAGLPFGRLVLLFCFLGGGAAGLAGMVEVAAVHGNLNSSVAAGYGFTGILVAFLARQNPLAILPVALLLGGIEASGGLVQRRLGLPDATMLVLKGMVFVAILASDTLYGRLRWLQPRT
jgi:simple sugar transport system permease protein